MARNLALGLAAVALAGVFVAPATATAAPSSTSSEIGVLTVPGCVYTGTHPTVQYGDNNRHVKHAQCLLTKVHGYRGVDMDGIFGARTKSAVVSAQKKCYPSSPSDWDGIVGYKTWSCLHNKP